MRKKLFLIVLFCLISLGSFIAYKVYHVSNQVEEMDKSPVDVSLVKDGTYKGKSYTDLVKVDLEIKVQQGQIKEIEVVKHECGKGKKAEAILDKVIQRNSPEVDSVSGATLSSEVIKDAIREGLRKGI